MQTTLELPAPLYDRAKQAALREGISLEQFIAGAIELKLRKSPSNGSRQRIQVPLVRSKHPGSRHLTAEDVATILDEEDVSP
jgi:hypothetical protein